MRENERPHQAYEINCGPIEEARDRGALCVQPCDGSGEDLEVDHIRIVADEGL